MSPLAPYWKTIAHDIQYSSSQSPLYMQLSEALLKLIQQGIMQPGEVMPSERILAQHLDLSRVTIRKAIHELVNHGVLIRRQGAKTQVAAKVEKSLSHLASFSEDMRIRGLTAGSQWLEKSISIPNQAEILALGIASYSEVVRLVRLRTANGKPIAIEHASIPRCFLPSADLVTESLYQSLDTLGFPPVRALQRMHAAIATPQDASLLQCKVGSPILIAERRCFLADGRAIELTETRYDGQAYDFLIELFA